MGKYFGTDGFRGEAGKNLTADHAFKIGRYLGHYLGVEKAKKEQRRSRVVIGKDTRLSSYMLEYAIASGLASSGVDVYLLHVTTTPSVSYITLSEGFDLGIMITASHNPFSDNGIKIIDHEGRKLGEEITDRIEAYLDAKEETLPFSSGAEIGRICDHYAGRNGYVGRLISSASSSYKGLKIGLDAANGAAFSIARSVFAALGAEIYSIGDEPNGMNVNYKCGSTHPESLAKLVKERGLDVGFAFDGDADRCIAVDECGNVADGDKIMYVLARRLKRCHKLRGDKIVATVMSNGGLISSLKNDGIEVVTTRVGDRFVYEKMCEDDIALGGEESGHIIMSDISTTGDGILTAIMITEEMLDTKSRLSELCRGLVIYPKRSESVRVKDKSLASQDEDINLFIDTLKAENSDELRVLVRESGTEPKVRIMVEAKTQFECDGITEGIISILRSKGYIDE